MSLDPQIRIDYTAVPSPLPGSPSFIFHLTRLTSTLFLWIGTGQPTEPGSEIDRTSIVPIEKNLAGDWAVSMPPLPNMPVASTSLYRGGGGDLALSMSQRLAKRFPSNQVHLSLSLPQSLTSSSGPSLDPYSSKILLIMEKKLIKWLEEVLKGEGRP